MKGDIANSTPGVTIPNDTTRHYHLSGEPKGFYTAPKLCVLIQDFLILLFGAVCVPYAHTCSLCCTVFFNGAVAAL